MDLKAEREAAGLSQEFVITELGIGISTIWRYENGRTKRMDHSLVERMRKLYADTLAGRAPFEPEQEAV